MNGIPPLLSDWPWWCHQFSRLTDYYSRPDHRLFWLTDHFRRPSHRFLYSADFYQRSDVNAPCTDVSDAYTTSASSRIASYTIRENTTVLWSHVIRWRTIVNGAFFSCKRPYKKSHTLVSGLSIPRPGNRRSGRTRQKDSANSSFNDNRISSRSTRKNEFIVFIVVINSKNSK